MWRTFGRPLMVISIAVSVALLFAVLCIIRGACTPDTLESKAAELYAYCKKKGYNTDVAILVDYGRHSGRVRFFVWDFNESRPLLKSICAQGCGKGDMEGKNVFSNEIGSLCTSLGHYKIGWERTISRLGGRPAFTLVGLDATNSNAVVRGILLHPVRLPSFAIYPFPIPSKVRRISGRAVVRPYSEGCITVPSDKYRETADILHHARKPVIMWVYK